MYIPAAIVPFDIMRKSVQWNRWGELTRDAPPFLAPEFFALVRPLAAHGETVVAEARSPSRVLGALPLVLTGDVLRALRSDHSPGFDYCGDEDSLDAIWHCLVEDHRWNELVLDKVPADSILARRIPELATAAHMPCVVQPDTRHPFFALPGFEANLNPKFRANLQRCARKAGDLVLERIAVPTHADIEAAAAIEAMAWKGAAGTSIAADERVSHFYEVLGRFLGRRDRAALYFLRAGGRRIATLFAVEDQHTLFALKIGFDPQASNLSPGHLLIWEVAKDAERRGLRELDFVGREDEWKRKWTDATHPQVAIRVYRTSLVGMWRYGVRELVRPRLPEPMRTTPKSPLPRSCQRANIVGAHTRLARVRGRLDRGLGIKTGVKRALRQLTTRGAAKPTARVGAPSAFPVGSWVRVRSPDALRATLDEHNRTRGLGFVATQWDTCGHLYQVQRHVRRIRDDRGVFRAVHRTVLLTGVDCGGTGTEPAGCGRHCPMMYRDEWLEPATAPKVVSLPATTSRRFARVRDAADITPGLDLAGRRDGLTFLPEMAAYAGKRFEITRTLSTVFEHDRWIETPSPLYILRGLHCSGDITGRDGPCDRACALLWHADWIIVEAEQAS